MLELDGSAGGGQLLRTALSLSAASGTPFRLTGVRGARPDPGLKRQHLAAVETMAAIADADVEGAELGSEAVTFEPGEVAPGEYEVDIATAGSTTLLFDAVLPLATAIEAPLSVTARGGTDVKWSPTTDYYRRVKLPLLARHGLFAAVALDRRGFYPKGGGAATLRLAPSTPAAPSLVDRGDLLGARVYSVASVGLADADVAERQREEAARLLAAADVEVRERAATYARSDSPGSALSVRLEFERSAAGFDALGEPGKPAEEVAADAVEPALALVDGRVAVDEHLADQLVVPLALAGGEVAVPRVSDHVETSVDLVGEFGYDVEIADGDPPRIVGG
ncbi:MAG: RNA 3'-terminal phosphate cyclase [Halobacteriales archaeon]